MIELDTIYNMDCLEGMKMIPDGSVDCIICDLPYGTTENKWDTIIPFDKLWEHYNRVAKKNAAVILFSQQPFTTKVIMSNIRDFRYEIIWQKKNPTGFLNSKKMPLKAHENICVFYRLLPTFNPQMWKDKPYNTSRHISISTNYGKYISIPSAKNIEDRYPIDVINFGQDRERNNTLHGSLNRHPTQKPVDLIRYLVRQYSNEGDTILDSCMGSGTTAIAAIRENRHFIGFELNKEYFDRSMQRIDNERLLSFHCSEGGGIHNSQTQSMNVQESDRCNIAQEYTLDFNFD